MGIFKWKSVACLMLVGVCSAGAVRALADDKGEKPLAKPAVEAKVDAPGLRAKQTTAAALVGGTVNNGPPRPWFTNVGAGAPIQGNAPAIGVVNYTEWKFSKKDFLSLRPLDILVDKKGERTGLPTTYESWTVGVTDPPI